MTIGNLIQILAIVLWITLTLAMQFKQIKIFKDHGPDVLSIGYILLSIIILLFSVKYAIDYWDTPI